MQGLQAVLLYRMPSVTELGCMYMHCTVLYCCTLHSTSGEAVCGTHAALFLSCVREEGYASITFAHVFVSW